MDETAPTQHVPPGENMTGDGVPELFVGSIDGSLYALDSAVVRVMLSRAPPTQAAGCAVATSDHCLGAAITTILRAGCSLQDSKEQPFGVDFPGPYVAESSLSRD